MEANVGATVAVSFGTVWPSICTVRYARIVCDEQKEDFRSEDYDLILCIVKL